MFNLYRFGNNKKGLIISLNEAKQAQINMLIRALHLTIISSYIGNEDESTILKKEQAEDDNREKSIQKLKNKIKKISKKDKFRALDLKSRILQKEKIIELIASEIRNLTARKNKAIKLYDKGQGFQALKKDSVENMLSEPVEKSSNEEEITKLITEEHKKSDEFLKRQDKIIEDSYLVGQQEFLEKIYITEEKSELEKKFKGLKAIAGQEMVVATIEEQLTSILLARDNNNYYTVIEQLQNLITNLNVTKSVDLETLKNMDVVKLGKKLSTQKELFQKYKEYYEENKENKKRGAEVLISPTYHRTRLVMEANMLRTQLNRKVVERVSQRHTQKIQSRPITESNLMLNINDMSLTHIKLAAQYCIAKLEQVDFSVQETLQKKCIKEGWKLDKQKGLIYGDQSSILLISDIYELSYIVYVEIGEQQLAGFLSTDLQHSKLTLSNSGELTSRKKMLSVFDQEIKKDQQKLVPYKHLSNLWAFCLYKALIAVKPEVMSLMELKASFLEKEKLPQRLRELENTLHDSAASSSLFPKRNPTGQSQQENMLNALKELRKLFLGQGETSPNIETYEKYLKIANKDAELIYLQGDKPILCIEGIVLDNTTAGKAIWDMIKVLEPQAQCTLLFAHQPVSALGPVIVNNPTAAPIIAPSASFEQKDARIC